MDKYTQAILLFSSPEFLELNLEERQYYTSIIAQNFCEQLRVPYIDFILEDFKNKTDGDYSARKKEIKLNAHFFEDTDNRHTNSDPLGMHLLMKIFHEYTHYYQHFQSKDSRESEIYKELIDPITDNVFYHLQETELNANDVSIQELYKCAELIGSSTLKSFATRQETKQRDDKKSCRRYNHQSII